jgi:hypothetical protein
MIWLEGFGIYFKIGLNGDVYCAALGGTWRVATIMATQALHTLSKFSPATENGFCFYWNDWGSLTLIRARQ